MGAFTHVVLQSLISERAERAAPHKHHLRSLSCLILLRSVSFRKSDFCLLQDLGLTEMPVCNVPIIGDLAAVRGCCWVRCVQQMGEMCATVDCARCVQCSDRLVVTVELVFGRQLLGRAYVLN